MFLSVVLSDFYHRPDLPDTKLYNYKLDSYHSLPLTLYH